MIEKVFLISFMVMGIWATFWPDMIFGKIGDFVTRKLGEFYAKPVTECPICMTFWYGSIAYWLIWGDSPKEWVIVIIASMGVNTVFVKLFQPEPEEKK